MVARRAGSQAGMAKAAIHSFRSPEPGGMEEEGSHGKGKRLCGYKTVTVRVRFGIGVRCRMSWKEGIPRKRLLIFTDRIRRGNAMKKRIAVTAGLLMGISMLAGCAETPETPIVRPKGENAMEQYREAEHPGPKDAGADPGQAAPGIPLRTRLEAPEHYESQARDATGKLNVYTDAEVEIPEVEEVPAIYVRRHDSGQEDMDVVTRALFGDADVYDAWGYMQKTKEEWLAVLEELKGYEAVGDLDPKGLGTDPEGNYVYDLGGEIERAQRAYETAPESRDLAKLAVPYAFQEELMDPWMTELGSIRKVYGFVRAEDGGSYRYDLTRRNNDSLSFWARKGRGEGELAEWPYGQWSEYDSMKLLYSWVPERSLLDIGVTEEEARRLADEKTAALGLTGMEAASCRIVLGLRNGYSGRPREEDVTDVGYAFHYTRRLAGIPITYTVIPGGGREGGMDSETVPWGYESLDIYVTGDGIAEIGFGNQYDIGENKVENLELLPFSDIMAIYEKMMLIQNADVLTDKRAEGEDIGEPLQAKNIYVDRIVFGYTRIYDPQSDNRTGLLVPVWDFFGTYEMSYDGEEMCSVNDVDKSFVTINAVDGTIIDRWLGY